MDASTTSDALLDARIPEQAALALPPRPARERPVHRAFFDGTLLA
jgi:hypothetical protein